MVANELGPLVPLVGLGGGVGKIRAGEGEGDVVCVQGEKMVHVYNTLTASLLHTWYADTGTKVLDVATNNRNSDVVILVNRREIVLADRDKNKMEDCNKIRLEADANEILSVGGTNYVVFCNGAVEDLQFITGRASSEQKEPLGGVLQEGETLLESRVESEASGQISVSHLVRQDHLLTSLTARLVLDINTGAHSLQEVVRREVFSDVRELKCFILGRKWSVILVTSGDSLQVFNTQTGSLEDLAKVPAGSKHLAITDITGSDQIAVMGTLTEGGFLHTFSRAFSCVTASCNMKTTAHTGRGLYHLQDKLLVAVTNRVMTVSPAAASLETLLGRMSQPDQKVAASLSEQVLNMPDMSEHLIIDCLHLLLESEADLDWRLGVLGSLVKRDVTESVMNQLVREKISLEQAVKLLELLELLLKQGDWETEERAVVWINMVVTSHYLQIVLSQNTQLDAVRTSLLETVNRLKAKVKVLTECRAVLHNLLNTKAPPVQISNQIYSIEVLQI